MKKITKLLPLCLVLVLLLCGCNNTGNGGNNNGDNAGNNSGNNGGNNNSGTSNDEDDSNADPVEADFAKTETDMFSKRDSETDYKNGIKIQLNGSSATCSSNQVEISGSYIIIKDEGTYILSGNLDNGMIVVNAEETDKPQLVLDNATINNDSSAALCIIEADKVFVTLAKGSTNVLSNNGEFYNETAEEMNTISEDTTNIDGTIFSKQDLTFNGSGSLTVTSQAGHGIVCKDDLVFTGGTYSITSASHGIDANDSFRMKEASLTIDAGKDGIHVENSDDATKGFVYIVSGTLDIEAEGDGISSGYYMQIEGGNIDILAGGGYENGEQHSSDNWGNMGGDRPGGHPGERPGGHVSGDDAQSGSSNSTTTNTDDGSTSMKGFKGNSSILINGGTFTIDSADDGIHSNLSVYINNGTFSIASGDDGIHGEEELIITGGKIDITQSYEGLEALDITISGGEIDIQSTDDGLNAAGGTDSSGNGGRDQMFGGGGFGGGMSAGNGSIVISGGDIFMYAKGDGLDANGIIEITGGHTIVTGPTQGDTAILDYDRTATITGGTFIGAGSTMMAQIFSDGTQGTMAAQGNFQGGTQIRLEDTDGKEVISYTPENSFQFIIISTPDIKKGDSYTMYVGEASGTFEAY